MVDVVVVLCWVIRSGKGGVRGGGGGGGGGCCCCEGVLKKWMCVGGDGSGSCFRGGSCRCWW